MSQLSVTISGLCPRPWGCLQTVTHCVTNNVTNPCYVTPVCHDGKLGQTLSRPPGCARGPGVAPGRDQAAVPGHDRPRHELHQGGCVSVSSWCQQILGGNRRIVSLGAMSIVSHSSQVSEGHSRSQTNYRGRVTSSSGNIALAGLRFSLWPRSSWESSNYTQLSISWDIFTSSDHVIKLAWMMMPGLGDAIWGRGR